MTTNQLKLFRLFFLVTHILFATTAWSAEEPATAPPAPLAPGTFREYPRWRLERQRLPAGGQKPPCRSAGCSGRHGPLPDVGSRWCGTATLGSGSAG